MFTGLIEEVGRLSGMQAIPGGKRLRITARRILEDAKTGDSIAVNGVCLTVTGIEADGFHTEAVGETLKKTTLQDLYAGASVNLERALRLSDRLGGHLVLGHVNGIGRIAQIRRLGDNYLFTVSLPEGLRKYAVAEGSIAIDGISLTIAGVQNEQITLSIIPHTFSQTNLQEKRSGQTVNLETDILARYMEGLMDSSGPRRTALSENWLREKGF
jgi:riboflavin synthase